MAHPLPSDFSKRSYCMAVQEPDTGIVIHPAVTVLFCAYQRSDRAYHAFILSLSNASLSLWSKTTLTSSSTISGLSPEKSLKGSAGSHSGVLMTAVYTAVIHRYNKHSPPTERQAWIHATTETKIQQLQIKCSILWREYKSTCFIHLFTEVDIENQQGMSQKWNTSTKDDKNSNSTVGNWLTCLINSP